MPEYGGKRETGGERGGETRPASEDTGVWKHIHATIQTFFIFPHPILSFNVHSVNDPFVYQVCLKYVSLLVWHIYKRSHKARQTKHDTITSMWQYIFREMINQTEKKKSPEGSNAVSGAFGSGERCRRDFPLRKISLVEGEQAGELVALRGDVKRNAERLRQHRHLKRSDLWCCGCGWVVVFHYAVLYLVLCCVV